MIWIKRKIRLSSFFLIIYVEVLFQTVFLSREPGTRSGIDFYLFSTWGSTPSEHALFIENIMMFVPFGAIMPIVFKMMQKMRKCVITGFFCSCGIEVSQLITQRGFCQLDDIVTNTIGVLLGWMIWKLGRYTVSSVRNRKWKLTSILLKSIQHDYFHFHNCITSLFLYYTYF